MQHPLEQLSSTCFRRVFWCALAATAALSALLGSIGARYAEKKGPDGASYDVVAFELMRTPDQAKVILATWGPDGIAAAKTQTKLDFLFLLCYSTLVAGGIVALYTGAPRGWVVTGRALAWGQWVAALADALENTALLQVLYGASNTPWPQTAFACALLKFAVLGLGLIWLVTALPLAFRRPATSVS